MTVPFSDRQISHYSTQHSSCHNIFIQQSVAINIPVVACGREEERTTPQLNLIKPHDYLVDLFRSAILKNSISDAVCNAAYLCLQCSGHGYGLAYTRGNMLLLGNHAKTTLNCSDHDLVKKPATVAGTRLLHEPWKGPKTQS